METVNQIILGLLKSPLRCLNWPNDRWRTVAACFLVGTLPSAGVGASSSAESKLARWASCASSARKSSIVRSGIRALLMAATRWTTAIAASSWPLESRNLRR